ncbi:MAG: hypothetical protein M3332_17995, partial [Actinomycetota bacterium]|nr:hypothetical protein [Actinomycetota bacterium]
VVVGKTPGTVVGDRVRALEEVGDSGAGDHALGGVVSIPRQQQDLEVTSQVGWVWSAAIGAGSVMDTRRAYIGMQPSIPLASRSAPCSFSLPF